MMGPIIMIIILNDYHSIPKPKPQTLNPNPGTQSSVKQKYNGVWNFFFFFIIIKPRVE